jgi:hypothetical protein
MRLSSIALLVLGASALVSIPAGAWESRALLSSELATSNANAAGTGSGSDGAVWNIGSQTTSGAVNTGDMHESYSDASSFVEVDANEYADTESEAYAEADVYQSLEQLPNGDGNVASGAEASGSEFSGTGASAYVGVAEVYDVAGSFAETIVTGASNAEALGYGSEVGTYVDAEGMSNDGETGAGDIALSGAGAAAMTSGFAEGDTVALSNSQVGLATVANTNPGQVYTTADGVAVLDAWSGAYGAYSGSETEMMLGVGAWANDADDSVSYEGYTSADANAGTMALYAAGSSGFGPGYSGTGGSAELQTAVLAKADALDGVGVGLSEAYVQADGVTSAVGKNTQSETFFLSNTELDTGSAAVGFGGLFSSTEDAAQDASNMFAGIGQAMSTNSDGTEIQIYGYSSADALEVSTTGGVSDSDAIASAQADVESKGQETMSGASAQGDVFVASGGVGIGDLSNAVVNSQTGGYGAAMATAFNGDVEGETNLGFSKASAGATGEAASLSLVTGSAAETAALGNGESGGYASGNGANLELNYGSFGDADALAHSAGYGGISSTNTGGFINQDNFVEIGSSGLTGAVASAGSSSIIEAQAESITGNDFTEADSSTFTAAAARGSFVGLDVSGYGSVDTVSDSETISGSADAEELEGDLVMTAFSTGIGSSLGQGYSMVDVNSFKYAATEGSDPTLTTFDFDGGSRAGSGALAASESEFDGSFGVQSSFVAADGYGSGYGDASVGHAAGTFKVQPEFESTAVASGSGEGLVGGGSIGTDVTGFATFMGLQAGESMALGEGYAGGSASFESPYEVDAGTYGIGAYASGDAAAVSEGLLVGGADGTVMLAINDGQGSIASQGTAGIFTEGAMADLLARTESLGFTDGGAGLGAVANDPADREILPYDAKGVEFYSTTFLITEATALEDGSADAYAVTEAESVASGSGQITVSEGDVRTQFLDPELNYAVSDGAADSSGALAEVWGDTISLSESAVLEAGDEGTYVQLVALDDENTALTGGFSSETLPAGYLENSVAYGESEEVDIAGIAQADNVAFGVGLGTSVTAAFGTDYDPEMDEVYASSGAFGGGTAFQLAFTKADGTAVNVPGTDLMYEDSGAVSITAASTPTLIVTAGEGEAVATSNVEGDAQSVILTDTDEADLAVVDAVSDAYILGEVVTGVDVAGMNLFEFVGFADESTSEQVAVVGDK